MLSVIMLSVTFYLPLLLNVIMLSDVAPIVKSCSFYQHYPKLDIYGSIRWLVSSTGV
jgi:hypothetical protein